MDLLAFALSAAGVLVPLIGLFVGGFWKVWGLIKDVRSESAMRAEAAHAAAAATARELAEHRIHTAETYVSKEGLREAIAPVMDALSGLGSQLSEMRSRINQAFDKPRS